MSKADMAGCCAPIKVLTKLAFVDGTQLAVVGLDEILAERCAEGRQFRLHVQEETGVRLCSKRFYARDSGKVPSGMLVY